MIRQVLIHVLLQLRDGVLQLDLLPLPQLHLLFALVLHLAHALADRFVLILLLLDQ